MYAIEKIDELSGNRQFLLGARQVEEEIFRKALEMLPLTEIVENRQKGYLHRVHVLRGTLSIPVVRGAVRIAKKWEHEAEKVVRRQARQEKALERLRAHNARLGRNKRVQAIARNLVKLGASRETLEAISLFLDESDREAFLRGDV
jgi:hypothetical protein